MFSLELHDRFLDSGDYKDMRVSPASFQLRSTLLFAAFTLLSWSNSGCDHKENPTGNTTDAVSTLPKLDTSTDPVHQCVGKPCDTRCSTQNNGVTDGVCNTRGECLALKDAISCTLQCIPKELVEAEDGCNFGHCPESGLLAQVEGFSEKGCQECRSDADCGAAPGYYCHFANQACGAGIAQGACVPIAKNCKAEGPALCGCDGKRYPSACDARRAGVDPNQLGGCQAPIPENFVCGGISCNKGLICYINKNPLVGPLQPKFTSVCATPPTECQGKPSCDCIKNKAAGHSCMDSGGNVIMVNMHG